MKTMKRGIMTAFCILATLTFGLILFLGCAKPSNNLISWQMTLGTVATTGAVLILFRLYQRFLSKENRQSDHLFYLLFTIWGGILILSGILCPSHASAMIDYRTMYLFASATDIGDDFSDYFAKYNNNFKPALYLRFVYRLGEKIGFQDPYYLIMAVGVLIVLLSALSARYLLGCHSRKLQRSLQIPMLITFMVFLPIYPYSQVLYTDSMSFAIAVSGLVLLEKSARSANKQACLYYFTAGILFALGYTMKATVLIPLIAYSISKWLKQSKLTSLSLIFGKFLAGLLGAFICLLLTETVAMQYNVYQTSRDTSDPIISWVALGLKNDGSYYLNSDFADALHELPTKEKKQEFTWDYIRENRSELLNPEHLARKFIYQFADADFKVRDFAYSFGGEENLLYHMFSPWGNYYWRTSQICFCILFSIYAICFLDGMKTLIAALRKKEDPTTIFGCTLTADLSLIGYMIFLMFWEANPRQLYNLVPILIWGFVLHLNHLVKR